jgi:hypothetical protein
LAGLLLLQNGTPMKLKAVAAIVAPIIAVGTPFLLPRLTNVRSNLLDTRPANQRALQDGSASDRPIADLPPIALAELQTAVEQGILKGNFLGNGRDTVRATLLNRGKTKITVQVEAGQVFEAGLNAMVLIKPATIELQGEQTMEVNLQAASTRCGNKVTEQTYKLSYARVPKLDILLAYAQGHPEFTAPAIQTAILAITENLPLSAVAKFPTLGGDMKSRFNTDAFRAETSDILSSLVALRDAGVPDQSVALAVDPQLRIEAMIDPVCRPLAMRYYGISGSTEWEYWRRELLEGDMSTRHYALYGIARFYPDTALEMLPKWAREERTTPVFRLAAVQALVETRRAEALTILRQLADDLGVKTELGRAALGAAETLENRLAEQAAKQPVLTFRAGNSVSQN